MRHTVCHDAEPLADSVVPVKKEELLEQLASAETIAEWADIIGVEATPPRPTLKRALLAVLQAAMANTEVQAAVVGSPLVSEAARILPFATTPTDLKTNIIGFLLAAASVNEAAQQMVVSKVIPSLVQIFGAVKVQVPA